MPSLHGLRPHSPAMKIVVLGAGVIGTASAWYLRQSGHEVTVVDRQPVSGMETSFANGGQVSASHARPWANPGVPMMLLKWLGREDSPLLFRLRADSAQWAWGLRFLRECLPWRTRRNTLQLLKLGLYSREQLKRLRGDTGIPYDALEKGILQLHGTHRSLVSSADQARLYSGLGCRIEVLSAQECVRLEPALADSTLPMVGGTYAPDDESGDAHAFTRGLEQYAIAHGVEFRFGATVCGIEREGDRIRGVQVRHLTGRGETLRGDAYLCCLGADSPLHLAPLGIRLPIYPVKGYSVTVPIERVDRAPLMSITHDSYKIYCSRLGQRLRVAGTAELTGYDTVLTASRCEALLARARELFPLAGGFEHAQHWAGLRPATPGNVPYIGRTRYKNLFLNTGHGTLGWTLACGSSRAIADIVSGRKPAVDFRFQ